MGNYSIKELEVLSGIKAHTLRIWEKRYGSVEPLRTETNIRYYSDEQLRHVLNLALLNGYGYKISKISKLSKSEIALKVIEIESKESPFELYISKLISATVIFDKSGFNQTMESALKKMNFESFCGNVVFPFLSRIGVLWTSGGLYPAQEHFASNLLKKKVTIEIDRLEVTESSKSKRFVLFLPEDEYHELSLLISEYLITKANHLVYYFGASLPLEDLKPIIEKKQPDYLFTVIFAPKSKTYLQNLVNDISALSPTVNLLVAGSNKSFSKITPPKNAKFLTNINSLKDYL